MLMIEKFANISNQRSANTEVNDFVNDLLLLDAQNITKQGSFRRKTSKSSTYLGETDYLNYTKKIHVRPIVPYSVYSQRAILTTETIYWKNKISRKISSDLWPLLRKKQSEMMKGRFHLVSCLPYK